MKKIINQVEDNMRRGRRLNLILFIIK